MIIIDKLPNIRKGLLKHPGYDAHPGSLIGELKPNVPITIGKYLTVEMTGHLTNEITVRQLDGNGSIIDQKVVSALTFTGEVIPFFGLFEYEEPRDELGLGKRLWCFLADAVGNHYRIRIEPL